MAWVSGPQQIKQVAVNSDAVSGDLIENFSGETEGSSYESAEGFPVDRGFVTKTWSYDALDYSKVAALEALMVARTETDFEVTYLDNETQDLVADNGIVRVMPIVGTVPDSCTLYTADYSTSAGTFDIATDFTSHGVIMSEPTFNFSFPFDGLDGCGRPYYGGVVFAEVELQLSGVRGTPATDIYAALAAMGSNTGFGLNVDAAIAMPNGNYLGFKDMRQYFYYGSEDASGVRTVRVVLRGTAAKWSDMIFYTDGGLDATPRLTDAWGTVTNSVDPGDTFAGANVEVVATDYIESNLVQFTVA